METASTAPSLIELQQYLPTHQLRQRVERLQRMLETDGKILTFLDAGSSRDPEISRLSNHILGWQEGIRQNKYPPYMIHSLYTLSDQLGLHPESSQKLYRNQIHTIGDALTNYHLVRDLVHPHEATSLLKAIQTKYDAISSAPSADELIAYTFKSYDPAEEKTPELKEILDMELSQFHSFIPGFSEESKLAQALETLRDNYKDFIADKQEIKDPIKRKLVKVQVRDVVSGEFDKNYNDLVAQCDKLSKDTTLDEDTRNAYATMKTQLVESQEFVNDVYSKYKQVGKGDKIMYSYIKDNAFYIQGFNDAQKIQIFQSKFFFAYEVMDRFEELKKLVGATLASNLKESILSAEKEQFRSIYGADSLDFFKQQLSVDTYQVYRSWMCTFTYYFGDDEVKKFYSDYAPCTCFTQNKPCGFYKEGEYCHRFDYLQLIVDQKDNQILYLKDNSSSTMDPTTYASYFKKLGVIQSIATMSDPKNNTQQSRVKSDKDQANNLLTKFMKSNESNAVMTNLRARSLAYYFDTNNSEFHYNIKYKEGNTDLLNRMKLYMKEPVLVQDVTHTLLPNYDNLSLAEIQKQFTTIYQDMLCKFQILDPSLSLKECEELFKPIAIQILSDYTQKNTQQLGKEADDAFDKAKNSADPKEREAGQKAQDEIQKALDDMADQLLKGIQEILEGHKFEGEALKQLNDMYQQISDLKKRSGTQQLMLSTVISIFSKIRSFTVDFVLDSGIRIFFKRLCNVMSYGISMLGFGFVFITLILTGSSLDWVSIVGISGQLITMLGEFMMSRLPRLIERFFVWSLTRGEGNMLTRILSRIVDKADTIRAAGRVLRAIGSIIEIVVCLVLAYVAINASQKAADRQDFLARDLYKSAAIIYISAAYFIALGLIIPGGQLLAAFGMVLLFVASILDMLAQVLGDTAVTSFLKYMIKNYKTESTDAGLVLVS